MIEKFINYISYLKERDYINDKDVENFTFYGDGQGDFEDHSNNTTIECLENYLVYLEEQKNITLKVIGRMKNAVK